MSQPLVNKYSTISQLKVLKSHIECMLANESCSNADYSDDIKSKMLNLNTTIDNFLNKRKLTRS